jgi:hypothetical protein
MPYFLSPPSTRGERAIHHGSNVTVVKTKRNGGLIILVMMQHNNINEDDLSHRSSNRLQIIMDRSSLEVIKAGKDTLL